MLSSEKMPLTAYHLSRKKLKKKQKLAKIKELGGMTLTAMVFDVPLVEELIKALWLNL